MTLLTGISIPWKPRRQCFPGQLLASTVFYELFIKFISTAERQPLLLLSCKVSN